MALPSRQRGAEPGERRGGRAEKVPNKITLERAEEVINHARSMGQVLAVDVLNEFMQIFRNEAYRFKPEPLPNGTETNPEADPSRFEQNAAIACRLARELAPFQSPTLRAIQVAAPPPPPDPSNQTKRFTLSIFDGNRQAAIATVEAKPNEPVGNGHDAQVVAIAAEIAEEEGE